ncbi:glycosyltransferase [Streptomyces sp. BHT-5-2]|uniref:glycosyltransferase n=1 Tax=unclassified Streptomyces TaxID=2593676 RepID=UPI001C8DCC2D|nr:glycosyltransferase [Streptomyces sp. BHT-5-2]QZL02173.1 glycosyltransferase [Streptomyces sp. BHT-5-2]
MNLSDLLRHAAADPTAPLLADLRLIAAVSPDLAAAPLAAAGAGELVDGYARTPVPTVTGAVLARDEAGLVEACVAALTEDADRVLLVDSGSTDDTVRRAEAAHPRVRTVEAPWCDDFAHHRNLALREVAAGWVMFVDADEVLCAEHAGHLRRVLRALDHVLPDTDLVVCPTVVDTDGTVYTENRRILRATTSLSFRGRVHERPYDAAGGNPPRVYVPLRLDHSGYTPQEIARKQKHRRNGHLLALARRDEPDNPKWVYHAIRDTLDPAAAAPDVLRERFAELAGAVEALPPTAADYVSERRHDSWVLLCELALGFGGAEEILHWSGRLEEVGGRVEAAYFRGVLETSRLLSRLSALAEQLGGAERWETPDNRALLGRLFEVQATAALASGRYELVEPACRKAADRGAGRGLADDLGGLRQLLSRLDGAGGAGEA